jgi:hypothetical protein
MKKIMSGFLMLLGIAYVHAQTITVASDRNIDTDFTKYKTFFWSSQVDNQLDEGHYFLNDLLFKVQVRDAVKAELMGLGYKLEPGTPDLVVNFRVFDKATRLKGSEGYGAAYWGPQQYRDISDTTSYQVEPGTLLISLVDRKKSQIVWHGFASGLIDNDQFIKDEGKIREAVNLIFDEYGLRAKEYSKK